MIIFKERLYKFEKKSISTQVEKHPLSEEKVNFNGFSKSASKNVPRSYNDPLSSNTEFANDPLGVCLEKSNLKIDRNSNMEPWSSKRISILSIYTTSEKLSIISSFLVKKPEEEIRILNKTNPSSLISKVKNRIEQLDQFDEEVRETSNLSTQQFTDKINELQNALKYSWREGQRVKSLQIIIQSTKLLSEASVVQFFPSKFVLITDLVDNFGCNVYERLKSKSALIQRGSKTPIPLPDNFKESQVPEIAKETAKNWFYKVASIRELVARLYIEAALLPCYKFFDSSMIRSSLIRLMKMTRGIGNPLLAAYARVYIARIGISLNPDIKDYLHLGFDDILESLTRLTGSSEFEKFLSTNFNSDKNMPFLKLFVPAVDWILQCLCNGLPNSEIDKIVTKIEKAQNPLLVHSLLNSVSATYIENSPFYFVEMISALPESSYPKYSMYKQLGACVSISFSLGRDKAVQLLKSVWKYISKLPEPRHFVDCAESWAEFFTKNLDIPHITLFLAHINKEMSKDNLYQEFSNQLLSILSKVLSYNCDFEALLSSPELMQYIGMFDKEHLLIEVRQMVLESFFNSEISQSLSDPVIIQVCIRMLKEMYDSLNSMSVVDIRQIVSRLIITLIDRLKFEDRNVEKELDLLTQLRGTFGSIEKVLHVVVERVNSLAMRVRSLRPNRDHNSGSASFVKSCMAFSYITIPSIEDSSLVIRLYTGTAQVALVNGCLGQAEACIKEGIYLLSKLDNDTKIGDKIIDPNTVAEMGSSLASTLLMCPDIYSLLVPDNQSQNTQILYLVKGLINAINICPILKTDHVASQKSFIKGELYIKIILLLAALSQSQYLYHAGKTDANDKIYGSSEHFLEVILEIFKVVVPKIRSLNCEKVNKLFQDVLPSVLRYDDSDEDSIMKDWFIENEIAYQ